MRRKTTGTGRMRYMKDLTRRFKNGFREGACSPSCAGLLVCGDLCGWHCFVNSTISCACIVTVANMLLLHNVHLCCRRDSAAEARGIGGLT